METYDLVIIGAGPGGYVAAIRAAQLGLHTALIEERPALGGTCLNVGCIPSKALLESSGRYWNARHDLAAHGVSVAEEAVSFDLARMMARKQVVVQELTSGIAGLMKRHKVTVLHGRGDLAGPGRVSITAAEGTTEVAAGRIVLAMGSVPVALPGLVFDHQRIIDSTDALALERVPGHLMVIGAGAIGLELGSVYRRLGAKVTVVELLAGAAPFAEKQLAKALEQALRKQGLDFRFETKVIGAELSSGSVVVSLRDKADAPVSLTCDQVLVAVGRRPNTLGVNLAALGVALDERGRVRVNERFETSAAGVYAIGDLIPGPMLAHKAEEDGVAVAEIIAGHAAAVDYTAVPSVVYTEPELAQVGITEAQAKEQGRAVKIGKFYFKANGRAKSHGSDDGLVKVIASADDGRLLGVHILGPQASELIAEATVAMRLKASALDLGTAVHAHPTLSEALKEAALAVEQRAIHA